MAAFLTLAGRKCETIPRSPVTHPRNSYYLPGPCGLAQDQPEPSAAPDAQSNQQTAQPSATCAERLRRHRHHSRWHPVRLGSDQSAFEQVGASRRSGSTRRTTNPIAIADQVVIPAGTFAQGTVDKLGATAHAEKSCCSRPASIFSDRLRREHRRPDQRRGERRRCTAWPNPGNGTKAAMFGAPLAGLDSTTGSAIGCSRKSSTLGGTTITSSTPKGPRSAAWSASQ